MKNTGLCISDILDYRKFLIENKVKPSVCKECGEKFYIMIKGVIYQHEDIENCACHEGIIGYFKNRMDK